MHYTRPIEEELVDVIMVDGRQALLLPKGWPRLPLDQLTVQRDGASLSFFPHFDAWAQFQRTPFPSEPTEDQRADPAQQSSA